MKKLIFILIALVSFNTADAQITKKVKKFFKYSTIYGVAGEAQPQPSTLKTYFPWDYNTYSYFNIIKYMLKKKRTVKSVLFFLFLLRVPFFLFQHQLCHL